MNRNKQKKSNVKVNEIKQESELKMIKNKQRKNELKMNIK